MLGEICIGGFIKTSYFIPVVINYRKQILNRANNNTALEGAGKETSQCQESGMHYTSPVSSCADLHCGLCVLLLSNSLGGVRATQGSLKASGCAVSYLWFCKTQVSCVTFLDDLTPSVRSFQAPPVLLSFAEDFSLLSSLLLYQCLRTGKPLLGVGQALLLIRTECFPCHSIFSNGNEYSWSWKIMGQLGIFARCLSSPNPKEAKWILFMGIMRNEERRLANAFPGMKWRFYKS